MPSFCEYNSIVPEASPEEDAQSDDRRRSLQSAKKKQRSRRSMSSVLDSIREEESL